MLTPLPIKSVRLYLLDQDGPAAALALGESESFAPRPGVEEGRLPHHSGVEYQNIYHRASQRLERVRLFLQLAGTGVAPSRPAQVVELDDLRRVDAALSEVWLECAALEQEQRVLEDEHRTLEQLRRALAELGTLNIDLGIVQEGLRFLDIRIGSVASEDVARLRQAVGLIGYTLTVFLTSGEISHIALAGLTGAEPALAGVLDAASFRAIELPAEFRDTPHELSEQLARRELRLQQRQRELAKRIDEGAQRFRSEVLSAADVLRRAAVFARLSDALSRSEALICARGWVPADRLEAVRSALNARLGGRVVLEARDPRPEERSQVPSALRYPRLLRAFAALVRSYGVPRYGEMDPTWLFALTFVLMFGMMFGDVGQGALIVLGGTLLKGRWTRARPFVVGAGISSLAFGWVYGSVFGFEGVLHPLWMSPLSDPVRMLAVALAWGVGFILAVGVIRVRNRVTERRFREAFLGAEGVAGLVLFSSLVYGAWRWIEYSAVPVAAPAVMGSALVVILAEAWSRTSAPVFERALVTVLETFETLVGYLTNSLSFLRVAAFSLNHVALAIAVLTLAQMMEPAGHLLTVVLGNLFILLVEGAIVAIQVLRLEYYEGFSRFYAGDGIEFKPLTLSADG